MNWRKHIIFPLLALKNRSKQLVYLKELEKVQFEERSVLQQERTQQLARVIEEATNNVLYYSDKFKKENSPSCEIKALDDLKKYPILEKKDIRLNLNQMINKNENRDTLIKDKTGGSTGSPIELYYTKDRLDWRVASEVCHNRWAGLDVGTRHAILWGAKSDFAGLRSLWSKLYKFLTKKMLVLDASSITESRLQKFSCQLKAYKPEVVLAYARTLAFYARYVNENNIKPFQPKSIITSAEVLTDEDRTLIESTFGCRVYNRYGSREFAVIASECEEGIMHINEHCYHLEFINSDGQYCREGEEGDILVTDLLNTAMPMIRYRIGDTGTPLAVKCKCGRTLSAMKIEKGRVTDFIVTPGGMRVSGVAIATYVVTNIEGIEHIQFYQDKKEEVIIRVVTSELYTNQSHTELERKVASYLDNMNAIIEIVDKIPLTQSGKMQFCINKLIL